MATCCLPHWTVCRAVAMMIAGYGHIDPEQLATELDCDLDEAYEVIGMAAVMRPYQPVLYSCAGLH